MLSSTSTPGNGLRHSIISLTERYCVEMEGIKRNDAREGWTADEAELMALLGEADFARMVWRMRDALEDLKT